MSFKEIPGFLTQNISKTMVYAFINVVLIICFTTKNILNKTILVGYFILEYNHELVGKCVMTVLTTFGA